MITNRRLERISKGLSKSVPSSTKISKHTEVSKQASKGAGYRTNRFK